MREGIKEAKAGGRGNAGADGYLTVFMALSMTVLLSLCVVLIEGARRNAGALETECIAETGLNSILAEYHRELFKQFNLFAIDSSYGTAMTGTANIERHLKNYLERNMSAEDVFLGKYLYRDFLKLSVSQLKLTGVSTLTDGRGANFRRRAVEAVRDDAGLALLEELKGWMSVIEENQLEELDIAARKQEIDGRIEEYDGTLIQVGENEWESVEIENPTSGLEEYRSRGVLNLVLGHSETVSNRQLSTQGLIENRMKRGEVSIGNLFFAEQEGLLEEFFFREYLMRYLGRYGQEKENAALCYQLEYLVEGREKDAENLKKVAERLLVLREAANAVYIFTDEEKCMAAELAATVLASLMMVPEIADLLEAAILLGWAYAESVYDVKTLLAGGKIPLIKSADTWHCSLQGALDFQPFSDTSMEKKGLAYTDYLRIFLMLTDTDMLTLRAMNLVEADIRCTPGNRDFCLDGCCDSVEAYICVESAYGYRYELIRRKIY